MQYEYEIFVEEIKAPRDKSIRELQSRINAKGRQGYKLVNIILDKAAPLGAGPSHALVVLERQTE